MAARMTVSVVICAYTLDRWRYLTAACLSAVNQTLAPHEVMVVVDHNLELLSRVQEEMPEVSAIANCHQKGLAGARNTGVSNSTGDIVAFLDDDAVADPDWLEHLVVPYRDARVVGVGGKIDPVWPGQRTAWFPTEFDWVVGCDYRGLPATTAPVRNMIGANMSFRREIIVRLGGFTTGIGRLETRPLGCEETELSIRVAKYFPGSILCYEPAARIVHHVTPSRTTLRYFLSRCYAEGLSKALVVKLVGAESGLSTERSYTTRTLPAGVIKALDDTVRRGDLWGLTRGSAIIAGLVITVTGYLVGTRTMRVLDNSTSMPPDLVSPGRTGHIRHSHISPDEERIA